MTFEQRLLNEFKLNTKDLKHEKISRALLFEMDVVIFSEEVWLVEDFRNSPRNVTIANQFK